MAYASEAVARAALERKVTSPAFRGRVSVVSRLRGVSAVEGTMAVVVGEEDGGGGGGSGGRGMVWYFWLEKVGLVR